MSSGFINNVIFGVYEIFANIIPGAIVLCTIIYILLNEPALIDITIPNFPDVINLSLFIFLSFIIGQIIQFFSHKIGYVIFKYKFNGYPSSVYLNYDDKTFPYYFKQSIRKKVHEMFGTPLNESSQHIFDICYSYVYQRKKSERVLIFLQMYTFSRSMIVTLIFEAIIFYAFAFIFKNPFFTILGGISLIIIYPFYDRFLIYGESFPKEVLRSYFIDVDSSQKKVNANSSPT